MEVRVEDEVRLAVVALSNMSIKHCWEIRKRWEKRKRVMDNVGIESLCTSSNDEEYPVDAGDDQLVVIDGPSYNTHEHIHLLDVMPLRFNISDKMRKNMRIITV